MRTIRIRISHNNNFIVVRIIHFKVRTDAGTNRMNDCINLFVFKDIFELRFFGINYFTAQGQDCLETSVASLLGRTAGRVTLY